jgi:hypothetical protein
MRVPCALSRAGPGFDLRAELTDSPPGTEHESDDVTECHTFGDKFSGPVARGRGLINADRTPENARGYASRAQPVGATGPKQSAVMSLHNGFSTVSVINARSIAPDQKMF